MLKQLVSEQYVLCTSKYVNNVCSAVRTSGKLPKLEHKATYTV